MAALKGFLLFLGIMGSIFLFYQWGMPQDARAERIHNMQEVRKKLLRELCDGEKEAFSMGKHSSEDLSSTDMHNLVVDDKYGIIYCYVPKVACTNWKKVMFALKQNQPYRDLMSISGDVVQEERQFPLLNSFPLPERKAKLKHYIKFLFVRDPFVRLISAYRDKFQRSNNFFYQHFGRDILRRYGNLPNPPKTADEALASGVRLTFNNFIQYVVDPQTRRKPFEPHWRQMHQLCHPCLIQYDFVGHQETLQEDAEHLLKLLNLEHIKFPPHKENMTTVSFLLDWFKTVPLEDRRELYKIYEKDFMLFGYRKPVELLDG